MRLRLFHQVFLLVTATALVAELAVAGAGAFNLRNGFNDYLDARDAEDLATEVSVLEARLAAAGGSKALAEGRTSWPMLLQDIAGAQGFGPPDPPPGDAAGFAGDGPPPGPPGADIGPPGPDDPGAPGPPQRAPPDELVRRIALYDLSGQRVAGPPPPNSGIARRATSLPIKLDGATVGYVRFLPRVGISPGADSRFLNSQYESLAILALLFLVLGTLPAWWIARLASRPLETIQAATQSIAEGDFKVNVPEKGVHEVAETVRNINLMARSLQRLDAARRRWLAEVSHELRTPLASMRGELDALEDGVRPLSIAAVKSVNEEAVRLSNLVQDLHFLAISDLSGPPCQFQAADAMTLCKAAVERFAAPAAKTGLDLQSNGAEDGPLPVYWDRGRIEQMLANLLTNSLRYTDAPGRVRLTLTQTPEAIEICIDDSAPPVSHDHLPRLFEPLYRVDAAHSRIDGGSGMGLAICEAIVRAHRGRIDADASALGGLRIRISLPRDARPA
jgi:two-component system sensor histidine kinase BaeS